MENTDMFADPLSLLLGNLSLILFLLSFIIATVQWGTHQKMSTYEIFYRWVALLPLGLGEIYAFIMYAFFPNFTAAVIGWQTSPFQYEVAMANLGFGVIALLSFRGSYGFRSATVIANTCWLWGDALGHIYQMLAQHNYTFGNAGSWFWMDIIIPFILIVSLTNLTPQRLAY